MTQLEPTTNDTAGYICLNPKCRKSFTTPLLVQNLGSKDAGSYYACPSCLTRIKDKHPDDERKRTPKSKTPVLQKAAAKFREAQETSEETKCLHHFGYLAQRPRTEQIPDECMVCPRVMECMRTQVKAQASPPQDIRKPSKPDTIIAEIAEEETKEEPRESRVAREDRTPRTKDGFAVDSLGMLFASWSDTVRIGKKILSSMGKRVKEVEIETAGGKKIRCKVQPMDEEGRVIQMPDKLLSTLQIKRGQFVKVRPAKEHRD